MSVKLRAYKGHLDYSYAIGVFPTLELLAHRAERVIKVLLSTQGEANEGVHKIREICARQRIPVEMADAAIRRLAGSENAYAIGVFEKYETTLSAANHHVVLVNPSDAGNLGAIARTMLGFDVLDLAIIRPAVDLFAPKTIRASMGAVLALRFRYFDHFQAYRDAFCHYLYPLMKDGRYVLNEVAFRAPFALVFGNEGAGLPPAFREQGISVRIPQSERIDSLNLAVSVGIALYAATLSLGNIGHRS